MGTAQSIAITYFPSYGGSGRVAGRLGVALAARGHRVVFVGLGPPPSSPEPPAGATPPRLLRVDTPGYPLFGDGFYTVALANELLELARRERIDLIHAHYLLPHAASALLARDLAPQHARPRVVLTAHGSDVLLVGDDPAYAPLLDAVMRRSDGITVPSRFLAGAVAERLARVPGDDHPEVTVLPNFVDTEHFCPASPAERREIAARLAPQHADALRAGELAVIAHVSNFRPVKRTDRVVEAFAAIVRDRPALLLLAGDGPERAKALELAAARGVADRVVWLGAMAYVRDVLRCAELFLLPSEMESFGLAALEAQACGVAVIASNVGGLPEVIVDGVTGYLTPEGDAAAMARRAIELLGDHELHARFCRAARQRAEQQFAEPPAVDRYASYLARVASGP